MSAQAATIISGIALLIVFLLVGWYSRRKSVRNDSYPAGERADHDQE